MTSAQKRARALADHVLTLLRDVGLAPCVTIYNHTPNFIYSMGPAQMIAARTARVLLNGCKVIRVARRVGDVKAPSALDRLHGAWAKASAEERATFLMEI